MRKIFLVSPFEPSGASWLINCCLELGIRTYRCSRPPMWIRTGDDWSLSQHEEILQKWLPCLSEKIRFHFREDLEIEWTHDWPYSYYSNYSIIYFIRDPRDSLFSSLNRHTKEMSLEEFIEIPSHITLLNRIDNWTLYNRCWLCHPNIAIFRFEDYKNDASGTLASVLKFLQLSYNSTAIQRAVDASTSERAAEAERNYQKKKGARIDSVHDTRIINRGGLVKIWKRDEFTDIALRIEKGTIDLLRQYGYETQLPGDVQQVNRFGPNIRFLSIFKEILLEDALRNLDECSLENVNRVINLSHALDTDFATRAGIEPWNVKTMINSINEFLLSYAQYTHDRLNKLLYSK